MKKNIYLVIDREYDAWDELVKDEILVAFDEREKAVDYIRSIEIPLTDGVVIDYFDLPKGHRAITYVYGNVRGLKIKEMEFIFGLAGETKR